MYGATAEVSRPALTFEQYDVATSCRMNQGTRAKQPRALVGFSVCRAAEMASINISILDVLRAGACIGGDQAQCGKIKMQSSTHRVVDSGEPHTHRAALREIRDDFDPETNVCTQTRIASEQRRDLLFARSTRRYDGKDAIARSSSQSLSVLSYLGRQYALQHNDIHICLFDGA
jgi:hypothetical protein